MSGPNAAANRPHADRLESVAAFIFEPKVSREQIYLPVAVDIERIDAFRVHRRPFDAFSGLTAENGGGGPVLHAPRIVWNVGQEECLRPLVPIHQLRFSGPFEVGKDLIVMLVSAA